MKTKYIFTIILGALLASCGVDRRPEYAAQQAEDKWIYAEMLENYLWYKDLPKEKSLNFFTPPPTFFNSLLSPEDGKNSVKYSRIDSLIRPETRMTLTEANSYGFEFEYANNPDSINERFARVVYTVANSPAEEAGLVRGDWIFKINDKVITQKDLTALRSGPSIKLTTGYLNGESKAVETGTKTLPASRRIEENPIHYTNIYELNGRRIGYVVYNSFVSGRTNGDKSYLNELAALTNSLKSEGIDELILDLRYNPGGELFIVPLWCSAIVQAANMNAIMGTLIFNDKNQDSNETFSFSNENLHGGSNLNLSRLFVLTSRYTASASEALISFLDPYCNVVLIGSTTEGKNVASIPITNEEYSYPWILYPIVAKVYNARNYDYRAGYPPTYSITTEVANFLPFGDPNEQYLALALEIIDGSYNPEQARSSVSGVKILGSSLERKRLPGAIISQ